MQVDEFIFRKGVTWGISRLEVKRREGRSRLVSQSKDAVVYETEPIIGLKTALHYSFTGNDKLAHARYLLQYPEVVMLGNDEYVDDFKRLKADLVLKYGPPQGDEAVWLTDKQALLNIYQHAWGHAMANGLLLLFATWEQPDTTITLLAYRDENTFEVGQAIGYKSKTWDPVWQAEHKAAARALLNSYL